MQNEKTVMLITQTLERWQERFITTLPTLTAAIAVLIISYFLAKFLRHSSLQACNRLFVNNSRLATLTATLVYYFTLFGGLILALDLLDLTNLITHLLAGAGIMGIIAGFAFKDIASNAFSGLLIKSQQPFKRGDWVKIDQYLGQVQEIGMITTIVKTLNGQLANIPNQLVYSGVFSNYSSLGRLRVILSSGVSYGDDLDKVKRVTLAMLNEADFVTEKSSSDFYFTDIGSSTYNFEVRFWIEFKTYSQFLAAKSDLIMALKKRFEQENISIAYNVTTLDFGVKGGVNLFDNPLSVEMKK